MYDVKELLCLVSKRVMIESKHIVSDDEFVFIFLYYHNK